VRNVWRRFDLNGGKVVRSHSNASPGDLVSGKASCAGAFDPMELQRDPATADPVVGDPGA
jgi:hypothetical protein